MKTEPGRAIEVKDTPNGYVFITENGCIRIGFTVEGAIMFEYSIRSYNVPVFIDNAIKKVYQAETSIRSAVLSESDDCWTIIRDSLEIHVAKADSTVSVFRNGTLIHGGRAGGKDTVIPQSQFRFLSGADRNTGLFCFALDKEDMFFGLGDKAGSPNHRGKRLRMYNKDALGYDASFSDPLYKSIPFLLRFNRGNGCCSGYFFASPAIGSIDLGKESPFYWSVEASDGPFRFFLFTGDSYSDVLKGYCNLTGFPALPPLFSFGYLGSSMNYVEAYDAQGRIEQFFEDVEKHDLPCEGMYVSSGYLKSDDGLRHSFVWNRRKFPDPAKFIATLRKRGYHLTFNIKPGILKTHPWYQELSDKGYFIKDNDGKPIVEYFWGGDASFIDFSNPEARTWWKTELKKNYLDAGAEGIWNDNNEFEFSDPQTDAFKTRTIFPCLMAGTAFEACLESNPETRPWIYSRSGYAGLQKYARTWTGDNSSTFMTLRYNQYQGLSMGLSGISFIGHDLGGFYGPEPSDELLVRCCQSAIFQSRFVIHSWREDDRPTEPWKFPQAFPLIKEALLDHYRHMPYIYNEAYHSSMTGEPMERMLLLEFPEDDTLKADEESFMFGRSVLKAPVLNQGQTEKEVRFPQGSCWYSPKLGKAICGGQTLVFDTPLDATWYFYRTGSIIPLSELPEKLTTGYFPDLKMLILPKDGSFDFCYFEDDGTSDISDESHNMWRFSVSYDAKTGEGTVEADLVHSGNRKTLKNRKVTFALPQGFEGETSFNMEELDGKTVRFSGRYLS